MKSQQQKDFERTFNKPPAKRCAVCGSPEETSPEGARVRMILLADGKWACNYCNNQGIGR